MDVKKPQIPKKGPVKPVSRGLPPMKPEKVSKPTALPPTPVRTKKLEERKTPLDNKRAKSIEISKEDKPKTGLYTQKPSSKLSSIKTADPFASNKTTDSNSFRYVYNAGGIPCRINHGTISLKLQWDNPQMMNSYGFDPLLVTLFEGLMEDAHPYNFISKQAAIELMQTPGAQKKIQPILKRLCICLRNTFSSSKDKVFESGAACLSLLSDVVGPDLNEHITLFVSQLMRRVSNKKYKEQILEIVMKIQENGGEGAVKVIKAKLPSYSSLF